MSGTPSGQPLPPQVESALQELIGFLDRACTASELDERLELSGKSGSVRRVAEALNGFLDKLWVQSFQLSAKQEMLEKVVEIRTTEVHEILDNVSTGFLLALRDQTVLDNFSRSCAGIFGTQEIKGKRISELMGFSETRAAHFALCYEQIFENLLPPEVSAGQLPAEFSLRDRNYAILATPILSKDGEVSKVFFSLNDTTELRKLEAENALRKALVEIVRQRESFAEFLRETSKAFAQARQSPGQVRFRNVLHTLKGNLGCYGLHDMAALVHTIEDVPEITLGHVQRVEDTLKQFMRAHESILALEYPTMVASARRNDVEKLRGRLEEIMAVPDLDARRAQLAELVERAGWLPARVLMSPLRAVFERVAERLDKRVVLELVGQDVYVDPDRVGSVFANLSHLIRNSLDHGIESRLERGSKPEAGQVSVACRELSDEWVVEVTDDGRGIDADRVCDAAVAKGRLTAARANSLSHDEKLRLIFLDGVTTKEVATMESGRGVGMSALLESVEAQAGRIELWTQPGVGSRFSLHLPKRPRP